MREPKKETDKPQNSKKRGNPNLAELGKAHRFKKGQPSANPGGRPKTKLLSAAMMEFLNQVDPETGLTNAQKAVKTIGEVMLSKDGLGAFKEFLDRTEGKVSQPHEISVLDGLAEEIQEARKRAGTKDEK